VEQQKMKAKILKSLVAVVVLVSTLGIAPAFADGAVVRFNPATSNLSVGQTVAVALQADSVTGLAGLDIVLSFNPAVLEVQDSDGGTAGVQIALGPFVKPDFVVKNEVDNAQGRVNIAFVQRAPTPPASGSGILATVTFKAKANGTSALTFNSVALSNADGVAIANTPQNGQVTVGSGTGPTPTTPPTGPTPTPVPGGPTPTPVPPPPGNVLGYHVVRYGETLMCIGRAYSISPWAIATENSLPSPYVIRAGQRLAIPNVPWKVTLGPVCARQFGGTTPPPPPACRSTYTVRYGDTLYAIALRYGTTVWAIVTANHIINPNWILVGQTLCIP
jgi:LysM repeat protein